MALKVIVGAGRGRQPARPSHRCPDENLLAAFLDGATSPMAALRVDEHLDRCAACRRVVSMLVLVWI